MDSINMMNNHEMVWMMICMIATTIFALIVGVSVIIQTFLQAKILKEIRKLNKQDKSIS